MTITEKSTAKQHPRYNAVHLWVHWYYDSASHCENDATHTNRNYEWANITGIYEKDISNFKQLCRNCHRSLDWSDYQRNYHRKRMTGNTLRRKPVVQLTKDNKLVKQYPSLQQAADENGILRTSISNCLTGYTKTAGGFRWRVAPSQ